MKTKTVEYTSETLGNAKAETIGKVFAQIAKRGSLTPDKVVESATPEDSPLHDHFEWDDTEAGRQYRRHQAAALIRTVKVKIDMPTPGDASRQVTVRAFVNVAHGMKGEDDGETHETTRSYVPIHRALRVRDFREQLKAEASNEMKSFRNKYSVLCELETVFAAMIEAEPKLKTP